VFSYYNMNNPFSTNNIFSQLFGTQTAQNNNKVNELLAQAAPAILCGPDCQAKNNSDTLYQNYLDAQTNITQAPQKLYDTRKAYLVDSKGTSGYTSQMTSQFEKEADSIISDTQTEFNDNVELIKNMIVTYNTVYINTNNLSDYLNKLTEENNDLQKSIDNEESDIITNDRKSYYESQGYDVLFSWYYLYGVIYLILLVAFAFGIFLAPTSYSYTSKILILLLFLAYPFVINYMVLYLLSLFNSFSDKVGKNVLVGSAKIDTSTPINSYNQ